MALTPTLGRTALRGVLRAQRFQAGWGRSLPAVLPGDGVAVRRVVDEADVDAHQRRAVRRHHLPTDDTRVAAGERGRGRQCQFLWSSSKHFYTESESERVR